jgi:M26 IgA1-specific Metallo-endopeptidase N-terminal region
MGKDERWNNDRDPGEKTATSRRSAVVGLLISFGAVSASCGGTLDADGTENTSEALRFSSDLRGSPLSTPTGISTLAQLQAMSLDGNYILTANIDASSGFTPIAFAGTLDGNNFTIRNLTINQPNSSLVGLFSTLTGADIRNLRLANVNITGRSQVGGIAGVVFESDITSSFVEGTVRGGNAASQGTDVGLIAGATYGGNFTRSYARGTVTGLVTQVGGFVGNATHTQNEAATFKECYARATVSPTTTNPALAVLAGGFIGLATGIDVSDVYALGSVRGRGPVGGLIAMLVSTTDRPIRFYNSYSRNVVTDAAGPDRGSTYGALTGTVDRLNGLLWDTTVDPAPMHPTAGQQGASTPTLERPTTPNTTPYGGWSTTAWDAGSSAQYHALKNVISASQQLR